MFGSWGVRGARPDLANDAQARLPDQCNKQLQVSVSVRHLPAHQTTTRTWWSQFRQLELLNTSAAGRWEPPA